VVSEFGYKIVVVTQFDIPKFDGKMSFSIWKVQMMVVLTQSRLKKAIGGKNKKCYHDRRIMGGA